MKKGVYWIGVVDWGLKRFHGHELSTHRGSSYNAYLILDERSGDRMNIGSRELVFIEAPMLHWPDSMFTYLTGENILMPNDAFGRALAEATEKA